MCFMGEKSNVILKQERDRIQQKKKIWQMPEMVSHISVDPENFPT